MKAITKISIIAAIMLPGLVVKAQINESRYNGNDYPGTTIVNNYYGYDYYYSSRINRFHRSFTTFNYYAPLFTDACWYSNEPYLWGLSIYGGPGIGLGFGLSYNYPAYYDYGWNDPYFRSSYYLGYNPFYFGRWYSPLIIDLGFRNRWYHNYYSWYDRNRWDFGNRYGNNYYFNNHYNKDTRTDNQNFRPGNRSERNNDNIENRARRERSNYSQSENSRGENKSGTVNNNVIRRNNTTPNYSNSGSNNINRNQNRSGSVSTPVKSQNSSVQSSPRSQRAAVSSKSTVSKSSSSSRRSTSTKSASTNSKKTSSDEKSRRK